MRSPLVLLLLFAVVGGGAWLLFSERAPSPEDPELVADTVGVESGDGVAPVQLEVPLPVSVAEEPEGIFYTRLDPATDPLQKLDLLRTRIDIPKSVTKLSGELVLRIFSSALGGDVKFHMPQALLDRFLGESFEIQPHRWELFEGILAQVHARGYRPIAREGTFWILDLNKERPPPPQD